MIERVKKKRYIINVYSSRTHEKIGYYYDLKKGVLCAISLIDGDMKDFSISKVGKVTEWLYNKTKTEIKRIKRKRK